MTCRQPERNDEGSFLQDNCGKAAERESSDEKDVSCLLAHGCGAPCAGDGLRLDVPHGGVQRFET